MPIDPNDPNMGSQVDQTQQSQGAQESFMALLKQIQADPEIVQALKTGGADAATQVMRTKYKSNISQGTSINPDGTIKLPPANDKLAWGILAGVAAIPLIAWGASAAVGAISGASSLPESVGTYAGGLGDTGAVDAGTTAAASGAGAGGAATGAAGAASSFPEIAAPMVDAAAPIASSTSLASPVADAALGMMDQGIPPLASTPITGNTPLPSGSGLPAGAGDPSMTDKILNAGQKAAPILSDMSAAAQQQNNSRDVLQNTAAKNYTDQQKLALAAPGVRQKQAMSASLSNNFTPTTFNWGGPGSVARGGALPSFGGGITTGLEANARENAPLNMDIIKQVAAKQHANNDMQNPYLTNPDGSPKIGVESGWDKVLGGAATAANLLKLGKGIFY